MGFAKVRAAMVLAAALAGVMLGCFCDVDLAEARCLAEELVAPAEGCGIFGRCLGGAVVGLAAGGAGSGGGTDPGASWWTRRVGA